MIVLNTPCLAACQLSPAMATGFPQHFGQLGVVGCAGLGQETPSCDIIFIDYQEQQ